MEALARHRAQLLACRLCPKMVGPVVTGLAVESKVLLVGQAPGPHEGKIGKPFAWTAGKTMFQWFESIGVTEERFRAAVYMAAVCRCFPGKAPGGADRVPDSTEIANCSRWLDREFDLLRPELVIAVGKLAISRFVPVKKLSDVVGGTTSISVAGAECDLLALPHPSGASTWHRTEPGKTLLSKALAELATHPAWQWPDVDRQKM